MRGFGNPGTVTDVAARVDRRIPTAGDVEDFHRILHASVHTVAEGETHPGVTARVGEGVGGTGGIGAHQNLLRTRIVRVRPVGGAAAIPAPTPAP
jgi:hypothetical protein